MSRRDIWRESKASAWFLGATLAGGAGACITGTGDHPLRHVLPDAINYFQHSGNMLWSGFLGVAAVSIASKLEKSKNAPLSAGKFAAAALLSGLVVGGVANAAFETDLGYKLVGENVDLQGGETPDPWDLVWGTAFTGVVAAGLGGDLRRYDLKRAAVLESNATPLPGPEMPPFLEQSQSPDA